MSYTNISYFFKRKYRQIERVIDFLPIIWKGFDFDYRYSLELFQKQLERQAKFFESGKAYISDAKNTASRIRTAIELIDKVYDDRYEIEWVAKIEEQFGEDALDWEFEDTGDGTGSSFITNKYEKWDNAEEIKKVKRELDKTIQRKTKESREITLEIHRT
jgi:hypothetical protein